MVCAAAASYDGMLFQVAFEAGERPYLILLQKDGVQPHATPSHAIQPNAASFALLGATCGMRR